MTRTSSSHDRMLSQVAEDYLKAIYKLQKHGRVNTNTLADHMGVSSATVTNMLKRLAQMDLVDHASYKGAVLTDSGTLVALEIIRHHRLLETYLKNVMGFSWHDMHHEAERLEHHISEAFEERIDEMLGYPTHDPHGHPIPTKDGHIEASPTQTLAEIQAGQEVVIHHVADGDPRFLEFVEGEGLMPNTTIRVDARAPFDGPLTVKVDGQARTVGIEVARRIFVSGS